LPLHTVLLDGVACAVQHNVPYSPKFHLISSEGRRI
jgi:hypothetical protein